MIPVPWWVLVLLGMLAGLLLADLDGVWRGAW